MNKYIIEFIGTYFLMLTICMSIKIGLGVFAPIAIGMSLIGLIYMGGHISKAHYNPAVTFAFYICKKIENIDVLGYLIAQFIGAILATLTTNILLQGNPTIGDIQQLDLSINLLPPIASEFLGTFLLCLVILNVAIAKNTSGNSFYGIAIGFTVIGIAYIFGSISGGAFNPAVAVGIAFIKLVKWTDLWIFFLANLMGGFFAAVLFKNVTEIKN